MKIKIFKSSDSIQLEQNVNDWLEQNPFFVETVKYSCLNIGNWIQYSVLIFYRLKL